MLLSRIGLKAQEERKAGITGEEIMRQRGTRAWGQPSQGKKKGKRRREGAKESREKDAKGRKQATPARGKQGKIGLCRGKDINNGEKRGTAEKNAKNQEKSP